MQKPAKLSSCHHLESAMSALSSNALVLSLLCGLLGGAHGLVLPGSAVRGLSARRAGVAAAPPMMVQTVDGVRCADSL